ncbi:uracil-DNA glycosylase family protein [Echinicola rosea]|uniref:Uracil-DNA glycosylase n=1 Tax=Echinicola rosea TaxID=1807691 RepID=A0ABQ1VAE5_9BACT|nr:uracil-DNA glycosylase family protein [Echinicola rosea]GGF48775.1 uracil-DNA glycosylase [Echinicola rosea]
MQQLLEEIASCKACKEFLPLGPKPIVAGSPHSKIIIIGQAPGKIVHETGIPWNDKSGDNLRKWLGVDKTTFYDPHKIALVPMGFCYPGRGKSGDLPPRHECAPLWHGRLLDMMKEVQLTLLVGNYAQAYYLGSRARNTLTETVKNFHDYLPEYLPLPHPSPRNNIWQAKNPWFGEEVLPTLKERTRRVLDQGKRI